MAGRLSKAIDLARFMYQQRVVGFDVPFQPHFDEQSTAWFNRAIAEAELYLEYGAGGSTLLADRLGKRTETIENDRFFARAVRERLSPNSCVTVRAIDIGLTGAWGVPVLARPTPKRINRWRRYVSAPFDSDREGFPDLVLVDGRFRPACALEVTRQAQARGVESTIMFDDYYLDPARGYSKVEALLGAPERVGRAAVFRTRNAAPVPAEAVERALRSHH